MTEKLTHCSFCAKHKDQVIKLIVSHDVAICSECVELCNNLLKDTRSPEQSSKKIAIPDPRDICTYLDQHVVGQDRAKVCGRAGSGQSCS
jgi:ATP-dependent Clp protease ATP-binding subunit ClpX